MKVVYCFITKNRHGCDSRQVCFQTERTTYIHSYTHYCVYIQGALHTGGISGVFLVNLKIGLLHYEKKHTLASIKCSTYMLVPALCFGLRWCGYPFQRACIILINLYMQAAQPKASNRSPSLKCDRTVQLKRAHSQCFEKLIPVFLLNMVFNPYPWIFFFTVNPVFRFRNQSLSIQCKDVLSKRI